jgi:hypothetical protein
MRVSVFVCALGVILGIVLLSTRVVEAAPACPLAAEAACPWTVVASPNVGTGANELLGISAVSANDVWAVGYSTNGTAQQALIELWNGTSWKVVPSPTPSGSNGSVLGAVKALSAKDVWAVGEYLNSSNVDQTLTEHWNGTSWSIVTSPNMGTSTNLLNGVTAVASNDVWAVGEFFNNGIYQTLTEQWNGTSWSIVASANAGTANNFLDCVAAVSANDIWAVGEDFTLFTPAQTLVEHWNGTSWSVVTSPNPSTNASILFAVTATSTSDVWAVGYGFNSAGTLQNTLTEHWNGTSWSIVPSPNPSGATSSTLYGVTSLAASNVWAVGQAFISSSNTRQTLIEQWNGTRWVMRASPSPGATTNDLAGVSRVPGTAQTWAAGYYDNSSGVAQTLTEFHC